MCVGTRTLHMKKVLNSIGFLILSLLAYSPLGWAQIASTNIIQGNISVPGERDVFTFSLTSNGRYYFDALSNINVLNWSLDSATGPLVSSRAFTTSDGFSTSTPVI